MLTMGVAATEAGASDRAPEVSGASAEVKMTYGGACVDARTSAFFGDLAPNTDT